MIIGLCVLTFGLFVYTCIKPKNPKRIKVIIHEKQFLPRKYRKWKSYNSKESWGIRYIRYLQKCKMNNSVPYSIPSYRVEGLSQDTLDHLNNVYNEYVSLNWI